MGDQDGSDDKHHAGHPGGTADQTVLSAPTIDTDDQEDGGGDDFYSAIDTSGKETGVSLAQSDL